MKFLTELTFPWVDIALVLFLVAGVFQGRKRGMSGELIDFFKWICIVIVAGLGYSPLSALVRTAVPFFSPLTANIVAYLSLMGVIAFAFGALKRSFGEKLLEGDCFGIGEYYLGMVAGGVRFACIAFAGMALLNARQYTSEEIKVSEAMQEKNFGSIRFFRLYRLQTDVFVNSFSGKAVGNWVPALLIRPMLPGGGQGPSRVNAREREQRVYEVLER